MSKYYTGNGDDGSSSIMSASRMPKDDPIIEAIGEIDELNSSIGVAAFYIREDEIRKELENVQDDLFSAGASLAYVLNHGASRVEFGESKVQKLESLIDEMGESLPELKKFVLPGGSRASRYLHLSRSIARRAERSVVHASATYKIEDSVRIYLNRLSSFLFVCALYINSEEGVTESNPRYG